MPSTTVNRLPSERRAEPSSPAATGSIPGPGRPPSRCPTRLKAERPSREHPQDFVGVPNPTGLKAERPSLEHPQDFVGVPNDPREVVHRRANVYLDAACLIGRWAAACSTKPDVAEEEVDRPRLTLRHDADPREQADASAATERPENPQPRTRYA